MVKTFRIFSHRILTFIVSICRKWASYAIGYFDLLELDFTLKLTIIYRRALNTLSVTIKGKRRRLHLHVRCVESLHIGLSQVIVNYAISASVILTILLLWVRIINLDIHTVFLLNDLLGFSKNIQFFDIVTIVVFNVDLSIHVLQRIILGLLLAEWSFKTIEHRLLILLYSIGALNKLGGLHLLSWC